LSQAQPNRLESIDALRGLAALLVALYHVWGHDGTYPWYSIGVVATSPDPHWLSYITSPLRWGYLGVSLFLVLSGFCIHLPSSRRLALKGDYGFKPREFFLRRIWRLYPAYFIAVAGTAVLLIAGGAIPALKVKEHLDSVTVQDLITHLTLTHGYFESTFYSIASVFWSLALEFQLYLAYPIFLYLFRKIGTGKAITLLLLISLVWRFIAIDSFHYGLISIAYEGPYVAMGSLIARMPEWLFGAYLAEVFVLRKSVIDPKYFSIGFFVLFALAILSTLSINFWTLTDPLFGLAFTMLIAVFIFRKQGAINGESSSVLMKKLASLGIVSYTFYLLHLQLSWIAAPVIDHLPGLLLPFLARLVWLSVVIGIVFKLFPFLEKPFLFTPKDEKAQFFKLYQRLSRLFGIKSEALLTSHA